MKPNHLNLSINAPSPVDFSRQNRPSIASPLSAASTEILSPLDSPCDFGLASPTVAAAAVQKATWTSIAYTRGRTMNDTVPPIPSTAASRAKSESQAPPRPARRRKDHFEGAARGQPASPWIVDTTLKRYTQESPQPPGLEELWRILEELDREARTELGTVRAELLGLKEEIGHLVASE